MIAIGRTNPAHATRPPVKRVTRTVNAVEIRQAIQTADDEYVIGVGEAPVIFTLLVAKRFRALDR
jgi:hypothetical protein